MTGAKAKLIYRLKEFNMPVITLLIPKKIMETNIILVIVITKSCFSGLKPGAIKGTNWGAKIKKRAPKIKSPTNKIFNKELARYQISDFLAGSSLAFCIY